MPSLDTWPEQGISGRITSGPNLGDPVVAVRWAPDDARFLLYLPMKELLDSAGTLVSETDVLDSMGPQGSGIIYDVTRTLDVEWLTSVDDFHAAIEWYRRRPPA